MGNPQFCVSRKPLGRPALCEQEILLPHPFQALGFSFPEKPTHQALVVPHWQSFCKVSARLANSSCISCWPPVSHPSQVHNAVRLLHCFSRIIRREDPLPTKLKDSLEKCSVLASPVLGHYIGETLLFTMYTHCGNYLNLMPGGGSPQITAMYSQFPFHLPFSFPFDSPL